MQDLHKYLANPFDDDKISMTSLLSFTTDHIQRMTANPSPAINPRLAPTGAALTAVSNAFTDDETKLGLRKARKLAKNNFRAALPAAVGRLAVAVEAKFGEGSPEFVECFPRGRSIFSSSPDDKLANELQVLVNGLTNHVGQLGGTPLSDAASLLTGWNAVFAPSETASGNKAATEAVKATARAALQLELFKNLLTIALNNPRQSSNLDIYMQMSLLQPTGQNPGGSASTPKPATK